MDKPYVFVNMAMTLDGKIACADGNTVSPETEADREEMDRLRAEADAVIWGGKTLRAYPYPARIRDEARVARRLRAGRAPQPMNGVVTASGEIQERLEWFEAPDVPRIIFTGREGEEKAERAAKGRAEVVVLGEREVPAAGILDCLAARGKQNVLLEGGGGILWTFIQAGLVDTLHVTLTPLLAGGASASTLLDGAGFPSGTLLALRLEEVRQMGEELFLRYSVRKE